MVALLCAGALLGYGIAQGALLGRAGQVLRSFGAKGMLVRTQMPRRSARKLNGAVTGLIALLGVRALSYLAWSLFGPLWEEFRSNAVPSQTLN